MVIDMTDRERLLGLISGCNEFGMDSIENIFNYFLYVYHNDISITTMYSLIKTLNLHLEDKIEDLERARFVANERAGYIKKYLEGKMWKDEETAKMYLQPQIDNAQAIIDACND